MIKPYIKVDELKEIIEFGENPKAGDDFIEKKVAVDTAKISARIERLIKDDKTFLISGFEADVAKYSKTWMYEEIVDKFMRGIPTVLFSNYLSIKYTFERRKQEEGQINISWDADYLVINAIVFYDGKTISLRYEITRIDVLPSTRDKNRVVFTPKIKKPEKGKTYGTDMQYPIKKDYIFYPGDTISTFKAVKSINDSFRKYLVLDVSDNVYYYLKNRSNPSGKNPYLITRDEHLYSELDYIKHLNSTRGDFDYK